MRLLIVEDDDFVADAVARSFEVDEHSVLRVRDAEAAYEALNAEAFDLAVIDIGLPGADGLSLVRRLRRGGNSVPTLILTARDTVNDKVLALDLGADDFLSKPFEPAELVARCRALVRRAQGALDGVVRQGRLSVDLHGKRLCIDGAEIELTAREWLLLECLVRRTGLIVSKDRLLQVLSGPDQDLTANAVEVHISRLRGKIGSAATIRSLRGLGYRLEENRSP
ncbi:MAG: response regulator [Steroidobacterales bacterium]